MSRWLLAARLARREVRRHLVRSLLVVAVIALSVFGAQAMAVTMRSTQVWVDSFDGADELGIDHDQSTVDADEVTGFDPRLGRPPAPAGAVRVETSFRIQDWVQGADGRGEGPDDLVGVVAVPHLPEASDVDLVEGRLPSTRTEVVVDEDLVAATGTSVGREIRLIGADQPLTVSGVATEVRTPDHFDGGAVSTAWVGPVGDGEDWVPGALARIRDSQTSHVSAEMFDLYWLTDEALAALHPAGVDVEDPELWATGGDMPSDRFDAEEAAQIVTGAAAAAIGVGVVAVTCAAAFAIAARRQLRQLGTLAAAGAAPADLRRTVLLQGTVLGVVGATVATIAVLGARAAAIGWIIEPNDDSYWIVARALPELLGIAALGVVAGTAAALVPAVTASRIPVLQALAGRKPSPGRRSRRVPVVGAGLLVVGLGLLSWSTAETGEAQASRGATVAIAVLLTMAGAVALAPGVVAGAAALAARRPGTVHLAGRSLARGGTRSSAVVASTAAVLAVPVVMLVWSGRDVGDGRADPAQVRIDAAVDEAREATGAVWVSGSGESAQSTAEQVRTLVGRDAIEGQAAIVGDGGSSRSFPVAVDPDDLRAVGDDALADALDGGAQVVLDDERWYQGTWGPDLMYGSEAEAAGRATTAPIETIDGDDLTAVGLNLVTTSHGGLVSRDVVAPDATAGAWVFVRPQPFDDELGRTLDRLAERGWDTDGPTLEEVRALTPDVQDSTSVIVPYVDGDPGIPVELIAYGVAVLLALAVIGTSLALAAADGRSDDQVAAAVVAPPTVVRRRRALEATLTAACAAALATGVASLATLVVVHNPGVDLGGAVPPVFRFPVADVTALAVGAVVVVGLATWLVLFVGDLVRGRRDLVLVDG